MKTVRILWILALVAHVAVVLGFWLSGSGTLLLDSTPNTLVALGRLAGLLAAQAVLIQFLLIGRLPILESVFGLDKLSRLHHLSGVTIPYLLIAHPILLLAGYSLHSQISALAQFKIFLTDFPFVLWAVIGAGLYLMIVVTSMVIVRSRLRYESWYFIHLVVYAALFLSFWHQIKNGGDFLSNNIFYWYWILLYTVVLMNHLLFRFMRPLALLARHRFVVERTRRETRNVLSIYITGHTLKRFNVKAGQFMIVRFLAHDLWWQAHPFSISMVPDGKRIRVSVKAVGDYTRLLPERVRVGTKVLIDGPYGIFTNSQRIKPKVLMIAGGIGITPIRSLSEEILREGKDVVLLYANRVEAEIALRGELEALVQTRGLRLVHTLSEEPKFSGEKGYIDEEKLRRLVPDIHDREVFLCGPPPMMEKLILTLRTLGVARSRLHFEKFSL